VKLDIAAETGNTIAALPRATYLSIACIARSRASLDPPPAADHSDAWERSTDAWLGELLAWFRPGSAVDGATEWLVEEPAPLRAARSAGRGELRGLIHRDDTDLIAIVIGVFETAGVPGGAARGDGPPEREHGREGRMRKTRNGYEFTYSYGDVITPDSPALAEALRALETGLEKYVRVVAGFRGEYIHPLRVTSRGEVLHVSRSVDEVKRREEIRQKQDEFLDAYLDWKATHRMAERTKLLELARQLSELDPSFQFSTPD